MIDSIVVTLNPFQFGVNCDALYNIKTGKKVSVNAEKYLLSVMEEGQKKRDMFVNECNKDSSRFVKPIKRTKIVNFCTDVFDEKNKSKKANNIASFKGTRDLFARLLFMAARCQISLSTIFSYPLVPQPSSMAHPDGSIRTTKKSVVMEYLEREIETVNPTLRDTAIIDGMFLLRSLEKQLPYNLRGLVRVILMKTMKMSRQRSDLVFDTYNSPSLKDIARSERGDEDSIDSYTFGSGQKTPNNFHELLKLSSLKNCFLRFFYGEIRSQDYANIIGHHELFCSVDNECIKLTCDEKGYLVHENVLDLYGNHDEADTRVAFHAHHASQNGSKNMWLDATISLLHF